MSVEPGAVVGREAQIGRGTRGGRRRGGRLPRDHRPRLLHRSRRQRHARAGRRPRHPACRRAGSARTASASPWAPEGHLKVPQIGRVIIQDDVEIGANSCVDRGALKDTVIGEGTKIDNLVQIGHNVVIGRHCVIVGQVGIAGSTELGDFVVMGGQSGAGRSHQDRHGRADRGRLACQGRRSAGCAHGRHAGGAACASGRGRWRPSSGLNGRGRAFRRRLERPAIGRDDRRRVGSGQGND